MKKSYQKIINKQKKRFHKKYLIFYRKLLSWQRQIKVLRQNTNWRRIYFFGLIIFIFISFFWFWHYNLISAKGFIKIFPKTAEGSFQNLQEILTLENTESSGISSFGKNNSTFPALFMQENIYSFEVNLRPEEQTIILPSENNNLKPIATTTTILGSTEIITTTTNENNQHPISNSQNETTTTKQNDQGSTPPTSLYDQPAVSVGAGNVQDENTTTTNGNNQYPISNIQNETATATTNENNQNPISNSQEETTTTTTTTNQEDTTTTTNETTTTTEVLTTTTPQETTTTPMSEEPLSKIKMVQPLLGILNKNLKGIGVFSLLADIAGSVVNGVETITTPSMPINDSIILSGFVLPELLEDEVLTQFNSKKENKDILNTKLGISFANKHIDINTDANLTIEIFQKDHWEQIEKINLNKDIDNNKIGSYYYVVLNMIRSVEDIETLQVRIVYSTNNSNHLDRLYIDSVWMEIAINSELEAIINDNVVEAENKLLTQFEEFYNFDQDITITVPKEQTKTKKIYKTKLEVAENIVEVNYNQTVVLETTTTKENVQGSTPPTSLHDQPAVGVGAGNSQEETTIITSGQGSSSTSNIQEELNTNSSSTTNQPPEVDLGDNHIQEELNTDSIAEQEEGTLEGTSNDATNGVSNDIPSDGGLDSSSEISDNNDNASAPSSTDMPSSPDSSPAVDSSSNSSDSSSQPDSPSSSSDSGSAPAASEGVSAWIKKKFALWLNLPKILLASITDLVTEETITTTNENNQHPISNSQNETATTTTNENNQSDKQEETTTTANENNQNPISNSQNETTTTTITAISQGASSISNMQTFTSPATQYQPSVDNSLVIGEEIVSMDNFKLRSTILLTPDRKSYRNNISIDENEKEYIITIHHGPKLIPGNYQLMFKYRDGQELYKYIIDFVWGGEIIKETPIQENIWCYFVKDNNQQQQIYIQVEDSEQSYYVLKINDLFVNINNPIGFLENRLFFIDQRGNLQGFDITNNSYFSQALEYHRPNNITINNQQYLISIDNGIISFTKQIN